ncbi:hypothetical protein BpHYR1_013468 [Brachionus plicatilis]|uniref:Uncharacterized protein n=1 Tax=Brachionus plicatilis TaxID=10195 RepID=A0A3M7P884_BRAPC|nr:hypothetical protein BpHYR1_013468 [Brachionus plicatilis]
MWFWSYFFVNSCHLFVCPTWSASLVNKDINDNYTECWCSHAQYDGHHVIVQRFGEGFRVAIETIVCAIAGLEYKAAKKGNYRGYQPNKCY